MVSTHLKNLGQIGSFPQVDRGEHKKCLSCHHLEKNWGESDSFSMDSFHHTGGIIRLLIRACLFLGIFAWHEKTKQKKSLETSRPLWPCHPRIIKIVLPMSKQRYVELMWHFSPKTTLHALGSLPNINSHNYHHFWPNKIPAPNPTETLTHQP